MRALLAGRQTSAGVLIAAAVTCVLASRVSTQSPAAAPAPSATHQATIQQYCVTCHNQRLKTGGLVLDGLDVADVRAHADTWENVVRKLRVGAMPPHGVRRPDQRTTDGLISWLESELDRERASLRAEL